MTHLTSPDFWDCYQRLPQNIREIANKNFELLKQNPHHPSLHFKKIDKYRTIRVSRYYRAIAVEVPEGLLWFWIGSHPEYDRILGK